MRRLIALLVVALVGATAYGLTSSSTAVAVSGLRVSDSSFSSELKAITATPVLQCYMEALGNESFAAGAGSATIAAASAAEWANMRIEGLAISQYVKKNFNYVPSAKDLAEAKLSLEGELTSAATAAKYTCPGTSVAAVAAMPSEMRSAEIEDQATSTYYVSRLDGTIPLTLAKMKAYYSSHVSQYDTICVSIALVAPTNLTAFNAARAQGSSVAELAKKFSSDPSAAKGGAYGCFAPSNSSYASVRTDVATTALNSFPTNYQVINDNNTEYALFVAPTKKTVTPFASATSAVLSDLQTLNATNAKTQEESVVYQAAVNVDPALGQWGLGSSGPSVFANALPSTANLIDAKILSTATAATYK
jgi:hypothetical protein